MKNPESHLQIACVRWFRYQYPKLAKVLFAVPNGGYRFYSTGRILKAEGQLAGVSDLILLTPRGAYGALCVEMKAPKGKQSPLQEEWQKHVEMAGNKYVVCHNFDEFEAEIKTYLNG